jgi:phosphatidylserine/phosphatidylglycerophosphate/cardiolipin synthase-like enzyme
MNLTFLCGRVIDCAMRRLALLLLWVAFVFTAQVYASLNVYFSPNGGAQDVIVKRLSTAKSEILVQAYSFTNSSIAKALVQAHERGVSVTVILDKSNKSEKYSSITFLKNHNIPVYIDWKPAIAHSKIMIIDHSTIITGSYNFQHRLKESKEL